MYLPVESVEPLVTVALSKFAFFKSSLGWMTRPIMLRGLLNVTPLATAIAAFPETRAPSSLSAFFDVTLKEAGKVSIFIKAVRAMGLQ
jgi:hypothetical protein